MKVLVKNKEEYMKIVNNIIIEYENEKITEIFEVSNSFNKLLTYNQMLSLVKSFMKINKNVPSNILSDFCVRNQNFVNKIYLSLFINIKEITEMGLKLLANYYKPIESINEIIEEKFINWHPQTRKILEKVMKEFLLKSNVKTIRNYALKFIISLWGCANVEEKLWLVGIFKSVAINLASYGNNSEQFLNFVTFLCQKNVSNEIILSIEQLNLQLIQNLKNIQKNILNHPHHELYKFLQEYLFDFDERYK